MNASLLNKSFIFFNNKQTKKKIIMTPNSGMVGLLYFLMSFLKCTNNLKNGVTQKGPADEWIYKNCGGNQNVLFIPFKGKIINYRLPLIYRKNVMCDKEKFFTISISVIYKLNWAIYITCKVPISLFLFSQVQHL